MLSLETGRVVSNQFQAVEVVLGEVGAHLVHDSFSVVSHLRCEGK